MRIRTCECACIPTHVRTHAFRRTCERMRSVAHSHVRAIVRTCEFSHGTRSKLAPSDSPHRTHLWVDAMRCDCTSTRPARLSPTINMHIVHPLVHTCQLHVQDLPALSAIAIPFVVGKKGWYTSTPTMLPSVWYQDRLQSTGGGTKFLRMKRASFGVPSEARPFVSLSITNGSHTSYVTIRVFDGLELE